MKRVLLFSASLALAAGSLSAQTADEIITRYQQAVGGAKRMAAYWKQWAEKQGPLAVKALKEVRAAIHK